MKFEKIEFKYLENTKKSVIDKIPITKTTASWKPLSSNEKILSKIVNITIKEKKAANAEIKIFMNLWENFILWISS